MRRANSEELRTMYESGLSVREIANMLGRPYPTIQSWMKKYGIKRRSHIDAIRLSVQKHPERGVIGGIRIAAWQYKPGYKQSQELIERRIAPLRGRHPDPEVIERRTAPRRGRKWTPEQRDRLLPGFMARRKIRPTKPEQLVAAVIAKYDLALTYVGDGKVFIAGRCPDFIAPKDQRYVVEVFGRWWHDPDRNPLVRPKYTEEATIEHYKRHNFECVVIWDDQLSDEDEVLRILQKKGRA